MPRLAASDSWHSLLDNVSGQSSMKNSTSVMWPMKLPGLGHLQSVGHVLADCYDRKGSNSCRPDFNKFLELIVDRHTTKNEALPQEEIAVDTK